MSAEKHAEIMPAELALLRLNIPTVTIVENEWITYGLM